MLRISDLNLGITVSIVRSFNSAWLGMLNKWLKTHYYILNLGKCKKRLMLAKLNISKGFHFCKISFTLAQWTDVTNFISNFQRVFIFSL
jgi:hypothetical protein